MVDTKVDLLGHPALVFQSEAVRSYGDDGRMIIHATPRLFLETWRLADFEAFAAIARDPQVMRFIAEGEPWPDSRIGWFMGQQGALQDTLGFCNWKLTDRTSGELLGICGLAPLPLVGEIEIGWWLKPAYWRKGLAFEAAERVLEAAFNEHAIRRIVARAYRSNIRSIVLMERLGMTFDRALDPGPAGDIVLFGLDPSGCASSPAIPSPNDRGKA
ncbi:MAG: GNAT family N-acetyltransferase [Geminicoccaceae bacterium]